MADTLYYVYTLSRPNGVPFYVGMGSGSRVDFHEVLARRGERSEKSHIIRKIWAEGGEVRKEFVKYFEVNSEAKAMERQLIAQIGRKDLKSGPLVNRTDGGDGCPNLVGETATKHRQNTINGMADPKVRAACRDHMNRLRENPEVVAIMKANIRAYWADPENRRKQADRVRAFNQANPDRFAANLELRRASLRSLETRAKMRAAKLGKKQDPAVVRRRAEALRGSKHPPGSGQRKAMGRLMRALLEAA